MKKIVLSLAILLVASVSAFGNIVIANPGGTGSWYGAPAPDNSPVDAFWDNRSKDGRACNIGYWLDSADWDSHAAGCSNDEWRPGGAGPGLSNLEFFANSATPATPVGWLMQVTGDNAVTLQLEIAGNRNRNTFGYYTLSQVNGSYVVNTPMTQLFGGPDTPSTSPGSVMLAVAPGDFLGFYLCPASGLNVSGECGIGNSSAFLSSAAFDGNNIGRTGKLALFREINPVGPPAGVQQAYWIGAEDEVNSGSEGIGDYQDFVVRLTVVPEPGFYGVLAIGMSALFLAVRRRRRV
jgi:hypothetical protein